MRIIKAYEHQSSSLRVFRVPLIHFEAPNYYSLIEYKEDWHESRLTEELEFIASTRQSKIIFPSYPCHTQAVERVIRLVSQSSRLYSNLDERDSCVYSTIELRKLIPKFDNNSQFRIICIHKL